MAKMSHRAKCVGQRSFIKGHLVQLRVIVRTHRHRTDCSTWATKMVATVQLMHIKAACGVSHHADIMLAIADFRVTSSLYRPMHACDE